MDFRSHLREMGSVRTITYQGFNLDLLIAGPRGYQSGTDALVYSILCLVGVLGSKYLDNYALFAEGVYILLGDCLTEG